MYILHFFLDSSGCILTDSIEITESNTALAFTSNISHLTCFEDNSGSISSLVSGGAGGYIYDWSTGDTTSSISNLDAATYILSVTDMVGCIVSDTFVVTEPLELTYTLSSNDISCFRGDRTHASDIYFHDFSVLGALWSTSGRTLATWAALCRLWGPLWRLWVATWRPKVQFLGSNSLSLIHI